MKVFNYVEFAWIFGLALISLAVIFAKIADKFLINSEFSKKYTLFLLGYMIGSAILYGIAKIFGFVEHTLLIYYFISGTISGGIFGFVLRKIEIKNKKG